MTSEKSTIFLYRYHPTHLTSVSHCMVCAYVREDNQRALASGLSPVHTHNHNIHVTPLLHQHACAICIL